MEAYQAYLHGIQYLNASTEKRVAMLAAEMLERAVALDPKFAVAHAMLSRAHSRIYHFRHDFTVERLEMAKESAERALALQPDLPEGHCALGWYYYQGLRDYDRAVEEFALAAEALPNDADTLYGLFALSRRRGRWDEALKALDRWRSIDPQAFMVAHEACLTYMYLRKYDSAEEEVKRAITINPDVSDEYENGAWTYLLWDGTTARAWRLLESTPSLNSPVIEKLGILLDYYDRRPESAMARLEASSLNVYSDQIYYEPRELLECRYLSALGEEHRAGRACLTALERIQHEIEIRPFDHRLYLALGHSFAFLGRKDAAVGAGEHAVELMPISKDALDGSDVLIELAKIYTRVGEPDKALDLIEELLSIPCQLSVGLLRLDPDWDALRDDPRLQALLEKYGGER
jgi:serine/threonine-protein kinase